MCKNVKTDYSNLVFALVIGHMPLISFHRHHCSSHVLAVHCHINSREDDKLSKSDMVRPDHGFRFGKWFCPYYISGQQPRCKRVRFDPCFHVLKSLDETWTRSWVNTSQAIHGRVSARCYIDHQLHLYTLQLPPNTAWLDGMRTKFRNSTLFTIQSLKCP